MLCETNKIIRDEWMVKLMEMSTGVEKHKKANECEWQVEKGMANDTK